MAYLESRDYSPWESICVGFLVSDLISTTLASITKSRNCIVIHNKEGVLYVKYGLNASSTDFSYRLTGNATLCETEYSGVITAIKHSGTSQVLVTES